MQCAPRHRDLCAVAPDAPIRYLVAATNGRTRVPFLPDHFETDVFFTTVLLIKHVGEARKYGTGFCYELPVSNNQSKLKLIITNKHVLEEGTGPVDIVIHRMNEQSDGPDFMSPYYLRLLGDSSLVTLHPDNAVDLAGVNISTLLMEIRAFVCLVCGSGSRALVTGFFVVLGAPQ